MRSVPGGSAWSFLLQPQGKVDAWLRVSLAAPKRSSSTSTGGSARRSSRDSIASGSA